MKDRYFFRGYRIDNYRWEFGFLTLGKSWKSDGLTPHIETEIDGRLVCNEIKPETVGQCTGLKDSTNWGQLTEQEQQAWLEIKGNTPQNWKGKLIFEGDVIKIDDNDNYIMQVKFEVECGGFVDEYENPINISTIEPCKIIGNVHDNPELVEVSS
jgi:hypothetical protein